MNTSDPNDALSRALADWRVRPMPDPGFRPAVWSRLQRRPETWNGYVRAHLLGWSVTGALAIVAAGWLGHAAAEAKLNASREQMIVSYLGEIDPRVMAKVR